jgi:hypothetical protein
MTKKPLNKIALAMWILAPIFAAGEFHYFVFVRRGFELGQAPIGHANLTAGVVWESIRSGLVSVAALVTYGTVIELIDQIRWNMPYREQGRAGQTVTEPD